MKKGSGSSPGNKSLWGSSRPSYFKEPSPRRNLSSRRPQRVRFRPRYASSRIKLWGQKIVSFFKFVLLIAAVVGGGWGGLYLWDTSPLIRIKVVEFRGQIPALVRERLSPLIHQNIFKIKTRAIEKEFLQEFPELKILSVRRTPTLKLIVEGLYCIPIASVEQNGVLKGIDETGEIFKLGDFFPVQKKLPVLTPMPEADQLKNVVSCLFALSRESPPFYSLIKQIKTDRMTPLSMELDNGVVILWGDMEKENVVERSRNVLRLLEKFKPTQAHATIRFVTHDRIVLDSHWKPS